MARYTPLRAMEAVNASFQRIPKPEVRSLLARKAALSEKAGMIMYTDRGKLRLIEVQLRPWVMDNAQWRFFYRAALTLQSALHRVLPLYLERAAVRRVLPLSGEEHAWVVAVNARGPQRPQTIVDRLDATASFACSDWREFWFLEPNCVGIGGVHYIPATCELHARWILPILKRHLPDLDFRWPDDIRALMLKLFTRHARAIGRRALKRVGLIEDRSVDAGTDEFHSVARYFRRAGLPAVVGDPREVTARRGEICLKGKPVDLLYRDTELREIIRMVRSGGARAGFGIREAFRRNQVISSIGGEFDHKSVWELFTSPEFLPAFTLKQRHLFRRHVLWTRLLWERRTTDPAGRAVDLVRYARRKRETLTLKPNRAYGGEGVVFGHQCTQAQWERQLARALKHPGTHVVQRAAAVRAELFPVADRNGNVRLEPYYGVTGFAVTRDGMAVLGRFSKEAVVNVSRRGGLMAVWRLGG